MAFFLSSYPAQNNAHAGPWEIFPDELGGDDDQTASFTFICL